MILQSREKPWQGLIRIRLTDEDWLCQRKQFWLTEMNDIRNTKAVVRIHSSDETVELELERNLDGLIYTAGTRIRIRNFAAFCLVFEQV